SDRLTVAMPWMVAPASDRVAVASSRSRKPSQRRFDRLLELHDGFECRCGRPGRQVRPKDDCALPLAVGVRSLEVAAVPQRERLLIEDKRKDRHVPREREDG